MAWPPPVLPIDRGNATPQQDTHPQDHNAANLAINDMVPVVISIGDQVADAQLKLSRFAFVSGTGTTDNLGWLTIPPSAFGLLTIEGGLVSAFDLTPPSDMTQTLMTTTAQAAGGNLICRVSLLFVAGGGNNAGQWGPLPNKAVTFNAAAWGQNL